MSDKEDRTAGKAPSTQARPRPQPSEHSSLESQALTLDPMDSGPFPESSDEEDSSSSADATSPGGGAKPSSTVIKTDPEDSGAGEQDSTSRGAPSMPVQKRRRVTRACDECRRKKIKCDGKQPCTHCSVYSYGNYSFRIPR